MTSGDGVKRLDTLETEQERFAELAARAKRPVVITGAGVSAESGVPTFRGADGLWQNYRAEDLATPEAFARDANLVWQWYDWRRTRIAPARPNPAHLWLSLWENRCNSFLLVTQNVDGLHRLAGNRRLVEIHGSLWLVRCTACGEEQEDRRVPIPIPPTCQSCGGILRPAVVWFGESLSEPDLRAAVEATRQADLLVVMGTSALVYPVAGLPALATQAKVVEINPQATPLSDQVDLSIRAPAGAFLQPLLTCPLSIDGPNRQ